jgi:prephenate dehydrogenase
MKAAIIGGYGKMGRWFAAFLKQEGKEVLISGPDARKLRLAARELGVRAVSAGKAVEESDVVILSVPIDRFESAIREISAHTHTGQLIFDVTSVKTMPVEVMHKYIRKGTVLGVHPMFGPGASSLKNQRFVLTPVRVKEKALAAKVRDYLEERGAKVAVMTPAGHDELMSIVLGLSHFIALVSADTLVSLGKIREADKVAGTTYRMLLKMAEAVVSEDPAFYSSLQLNLPGLVKMENIFQEKAGRWASLVEKGKRHEFINRMNNLKDAFEKEDPGFGSAYHDMYKLIQ